MIRVPFFTIYIKTVAAVAHMDKMRQRQHNKYQDREKWKKQRNSMFRDFNLMASVRMCEMCLS